MSTLKLVQFFQHTTRRISKLQPQIRYSSFRSSPFLEDLGDIKTKYEVTRDPEEWKHVLNVLPPSVVPEPTKKSQYPSGWQPPADNMADRPYYVERTKNHMIPVYLISTDRNQRKLTYVRKIKGDIWLLHQELKDFLQKESIARIRSQVNEFAGYICIHGDRVNAIKYYLTQKGY